jgi:hypothetical protein
MKTNMKKTTPETVMTVSVGILRALLQSKCRLGAPSAAALICIKAPGARAAQGPAFNIRSHQ